MNELYAKVFARTYGFKSIGLRYFNIFGRRQDPDGAYAAVIPKWIAAMIKNQAVYINGDGETSRDFCYIDNAIQANLLAATVEAESATDQIYNVSIGGRTSLNELYEYLRMNLTGIYPHLEKMRPEYREFRPGDVRHSMADIAKAREFLGYAPVWRVQDGLREAIDWYAKTLTA